MKAVPKVCFASATFFECNFRSFWNKGCRLYSFFIPSADGILNRLRPVRFLRFIGSRTGAVIFAAIIIPTNL